MTLPDLFATLGFGKDGRGYQTTEFLFALLYLWWVRDGTLSGQAAWQGLIAVAIVAGVRVLTKGGRCVPAEVQARVRLAELRAERASQERERVLGAQGAVDRVVEKLGTGTGSRADHGANLPR